MARQTPKSPPLPSPVQTPEPTGLARAWATWLQPALAALILLLVLGGGYLLVKREIIPRYWIGTLATCSLLAAPLLSILQQTLEDPEASSSRKSLIILLLVAVMTAAAAPVVWLSLPASSVFEITLDKVDAPQKIPPQMGGTRDWVAELTGELDEKAGGFQSTYGIRIEGEDGHFLMKGKFERKLGVNRDTGEKDFFNLNQDLHRFSLDLSGSGALKFYRKEPGVNSVSVRLRAQLASWGYFLVALLPLMVLASLVDATERTMNKVPFHTARISFMLWLGFVFANSTKPHDFAGPLLASAAVALTLGLAVAVVLPRLTKRFLPKGKR